jgi:uncharacterized protein YfdQ (DUF2303 family)
MSNVSDTVELVQSNILHALEPRIIKNDDGREFLASPPNPNSGEPSWLVQELTLPNAIAPIAPKIITQAVKLQDSYSLIEYVNRFKDADSVLFADIVSSTILAVIDYHTGAGSTVAGLEGSDPTARHTKHTALLTLPLSLEWQTWMGIDGKMMSHVDFANFLEEHAIDILPLDTLHNSSGEVIEDAPTTIYELCREMQLRSNYGASSVVRNGDYLSIEMQKGDDITTKRNVSMPASINLDVPVYFGEQPVRVVALMRQRAVDGKILMGVKLRRPEQVRQDEFKRSVHDIALQVDLTTLYGKLA